MIRYHCWSGQLPLIETTLAAHGYQVEVPLKRRSNDAGTMVMICGLTSVLLTQLPDNATLEISIWGVAQPVIANVLEALPVRLHKQPAPAIVGREHA